MHLQTALAHHLFIYTLSTHYPLRHASLPDPRMERVSILPLWSASKVYHLFGVEGDIGCVLTMTQVAT
jgi:hypothetical protein